MDILLSLLRIDRPISVMLAGCLKHGSMCLADICRGAPEAVEQGGRGAVGGAAANDGRHFPGGRRAPLVAAQLLPAVAKVCAAAPTRCATAAGHPRPGVPLNFPHCLRAQACRIEPYFTGVHWCSMKK